MLQLRGTTGPEATATSLVPQKPRRTTYLPPDRRTARRYCFAFLDAKSDIRVSTSRSAKHCDPKSASPGSSLTRCRCCSKSTRVHQVTSKQWLIRSEQFPTRYTTDRSFHCNPRLPSIFDFRVVSSQLWAQSQPQRQPLSSSDAPLQKCGRKSNRHE